MFELNRLLSRGKKALEKKQYLESLEYFKAARQLAPQAQEVKYWLGLSYYYNKETSSAIDCLEEVKDFCPENPEFLYYLGDAYRQAGKFEEAKTHLKLAIQYFAKFPEAYLALGQLELKQNNRQGALYYFSRAVLLDPLIVKTRLVNLLSA